MRATVAQVKMALSSPEDRFHTSQRGDPGCKNTQMDRKEKESGNPLPQSPLQVYSRIFTTIFSVGLLGTAVPEV